MVALGREAQLIRNGLTLRKPPAPRLDTLKATLAKKHTNLDSAKQARDKAQRLVANLKLEIHEIEEQITFAEKELLATSLQPTTLTSSHLQILSLAAQGLSPQDATMFAELLEKVENVIDQNSRSTGASVLTPRKPSGLVGTKS